MRIAVVLGKLLDPVVEDGKKLFEEMVGSLLDNTNPISLQTLRNAIPQEVLTDLNSAVAIFGDGEKEHLECVLRLSKVSRKNLRTLQVLATWFVDARA